MGRFMIFFGIILIFVGIGLMIAVLAVEDVPFMQDILVEQFCEPGEGKITTAQRLSFGGSQNSTTVFFCDDNEGNRREITEEIVLVVLGVFLVPFILGMLMIFAGARRASRKSLDFDNVVYTNSELNISPEQREILQSVIGAFSASPSLTNRLKQLEDAYQQGLISHQEYERTRKAILDAMDDNI